MDLTLPPVDRLEDRSVRRDVLFLDPSVAASFLYDLNGAMDRNEKTGSLSKRRAQSTRIVHDADTTLYSGR